MLKDFYCGDPNTSIRLDQNLEVCEYCFFKIKSE